MQTVTSTTIAKKKPIKPFVKWVWGKTQLLNELIEHMPNNFNRYIEPFVWWGALFFNLMPTKAIINDSNEELINTYCVIRDDVDSLILELEKFKYNADDYYSIRSMDLSNLSAVQRASRFIYLNKTCFNWMYRVNKKWLFNVPIWRYSNPTICDEDRLRDAHLALHNVDICCNDYKSIINYANYWDFVYIDPPYQPISKYSDFKRYTKDFFYEKDQIELRDKIVELRDKWCFVMASNSYCDFILDLYKDFDIKIVNAKRCINKDATKRNNAKEVIILWYK